MSISLRNLSNKFLAWSKIHQAPRTAEYYEHFIVKFLDYLGDKADMKAKKLKPYDIDEWTDSHHDTWGSNHRRGAVVSLNRLYNWGVKTGHINENPIKSAFKPPAETRKIYMKPEDYDAILSTLGEADSFRDLLVFTWITGVRPQEGRAIEHRHINLEKGYVLFPKEESKGKRYPRKILLNDAAKEILLRNMEKNKEGKIFRNNRGTEWTKWAVCNRMHRISKKIGTRMFMYAARHGYATRKLKAKHGHLEIAATMGHRDGSMIAKVYSHVHEEDEHLRSVLVD